MVPALMLRPRALGALLMTLLLVAAGCGKEESKDAPATPSPVIGQEGDEAKAAESLGFPGFATKNTTRIGGADPTADAAAVAVAVFPSQSAASRPAVVTLVDDDDWRGGIAASVLMSAPLRAPILLSSGDGLPAASDEALQKLNPRGSRLAGNAQIVRVGDVARPGDYETTDIDADDPAALARAIDRFQSSAAGQPSENVVIVSQDAPQFAMPAAAWAAKSGDPILFVTRNSIPRETREALVEHDKPGIYVLGPPNVVSDKVLADLKGLGPTTRISGADPVRNAVAFARFKDERFGWGVVEPGHGLAFANPGRPLDAAAGAAVSGSGSYGPLLLVDDAGRLPPVVRGFLLDIQPGYQVDPARGVYNHGWLLGDDEAITLADQAQIDTLLEIAPISDTTTPAQ